MKKAIELVSKPALCASKFYKNFDQADVITEQLDQYYKDHKATLDDDIKQAASELFSREEW
jgi:hypothetical protein